MDEKGETDIAALINEKVVNNLSVLGTSFGSLVATQDGIIVNYPDGQQESLMDIVSPVIERLDLGRLGQFIDFASDGGRKDQQPVPAPVPASDPTPSMEQAYVDSAYSDQNFFTLTFIGADGALLNPTQSPILYVDVCTDVCQTYEYAMDLTSDWDYSYTVP